MWKRKSSTLFNPYSSSVIWQILIHPEVEKWLMKLTPKKADSVVAAIDLLEQRGPLLGRPLVDRIHHSRVHNLKELRPPGNSIRIIFSFDSNRRALLLASGDKFGSWNRWYQINIAIAEARLKEFNNQNGNLHE